MNVHCFFHIHLSPYPPEVGSDVGGEKQLREALTTRADNLRCESHRLRKELDALRRHHVAMADDFSQSLQATKECITSAVRAYRRLGGGCIAMCL